MSEEANTNNKKINDDDYTKSNEDVSTKPKNYEGNKYVLLSMCFLTWFSSAFIFVQIPTLAREIKIEIFPSTDVVTSILMVSVTLSISLIARFLGGLVLGSYTNTNGIKIIIYSIFILTALTGCQIGLISIFQSLNDLVVIPVIFIVIRFLIGFFIGGIWPNLGIFTLEEFYRKDYKNDNEKKKDEEFRKKVQRYGLFSAFIQTGLTFSFLVESIIIILVSIYSDTFERVFGELIPNMNLLTTQFTSIIGIILLLIACVYWYNYNHTHKDLHNKYYKQFLFVSSNKNSLKDLLTNKKYRFTLLHLWLIITGLMYMYYSTVIIIPELLYRFSLPFLFHEESIKILIATFSVLGHILLGFFYLRKKYKEEDENKENKDLNLIYKMSIVIMGSVIVAMATILLLFFFQNISNFIYVIIVIQISLAFLANSPWGLIPSILTSRFPKHFRFLAASLAYNGGLVFSFASPFLLQQVIISSQYNNSLSYFFSLSAMFFGGVSIWLGSRALLKDFLNYRISGERASGYFEIRTRDKWNEEQLTYNLSSNNLDYTCVNEYKLSNRKGWMISIYLIKNKNTPTFSQYESVSLLRELVRRKIEEEKVLGESFRCIIEGKKDDYYTSESEDEEVYMNSTLANKKSFFIQNIEEYLSTLSISYSNNIYLILYRDNQENEDDNRQMIKILNTFDIKIPLMEQKNS